MDELAPIREFDMPSPMTFKEEGGVSLSPDGRRFLAVSEGVESVSGALYCDIYHVLVQYYYISWF